MSSEANEPRRTCVWLQRVKRRPPSARPFGDENEVIFIDDDGDVSNNDTIKRTSASVSHGYRSTSCNVDTNKRILGPRRCSKSIQVSTKMVDKEVQVNLSDPMPQRLTVRNFEDIKATFNRCRNNGVQQNGKSLLKERPNGFSREDLEESADGSTINCVIKRKIQTGNNLTMPIVDKNTTSNQRHLPNILRRQPSNKELTNSNFNDNSIQKLNMAVQQPSLLLNNLHSHPPQLLPTAQNENFRKSPANFKYQNNVNSDVRYIIQNPLKSATNKQFVQKQAGKGNTNSHRNNISKNVTNTTIYKNNFIHNFNNNRMMVGNNNNYLNNEIVPVILPDAINPTAALKEIERQYPTRIIDENAVDDEICVINNNDISIVQKTFIRPKSVNNIAPSHQVDLTNCVRPTTGVFPNFHNTNNSELVNKKSENDNNVLRPRTPGRKRPTEIERLLEANPYREKGIQLTKEDSGTRTRATIRRKPLKDYDGDLGDRKKNYDRARSVTPTKLRGPGRPKLPKVDDPIYVPRSKTPVEFQPVENRDFCEACWTQHTVENPCSRKRKQTLCYKEFTDESEIDVPAKVSIPIKRRTRTKSVV